MAYEAPSAPPPTWPARQAVLNADPPPQPNRSRSRRRDNPIPVRVRIVWERVGETWLDAVAVDWIRRHVRVELDDPRLHTLAVWLDASDVSRK